MSQMSANNLISSEENAGASITPALKLPPINTSHNQNLSTQQTALQQLNPARSLQAEHSSALSSASVNNIPLSILVEQQERQRNEAVNTAQHAKLARHFDISPNKVNSTHQRRRTLMAVEAPVFVERGKVEKYVTNISLGLFAVAGAVMYAAVVYVIYLDSESSADPAVH